MHVCMLGGYHGKLKIVDMAGACRGDLYLFDVKLAIDIMRDERSVGQVLPNREMFEFAMLLDTLGVQSFLMYHSVDNLLKLAILDFKTHEEMEGIATATNDKKGDQSSEANARVEEMPAQLTRADARWTKVNAFLGNRITFTGNYKEQGASLIEAGKSL